MRRASWEDLLEILPEAEGAKEGFGFVYIAESKSGFVKVGYSKAPERRVTVMNGAVTRKEFADTHGFDPGPARVRVVVPRSGRERERAVHVALAVEAMGGEWFHGYMSRALCKLLVEVSRQTPGTAYRSEGQRLLLAATAERGSAKRMADAVGADPSMMSIWRSGKGSPETRFRIGLERVAGIPLLDWDREPESEAA